MKGPYLVSYWAREQLISDPFPRGKGQPVPENHWGARIQEMHRLLSGQFRSQNVSQTPSSTAGRAGLRSGQRGGPSESKSRSNKGKHSNYIPDRELERLRGGGLSRSTSRGKSPLQHAGACGRCLHVSRMCSARNPRDRPCWACLQDGEAFARACKDEVKAAVHDNRYHPYSRPGGGGSGPRGFGDDEDDDDDYAQPGPGESYNTGINQTLCGREVGGPSGYNLRHGVSSPA